jgi:enoyl-[acyl-carrier protein] reductase II
MRTSITELFAIEYPILNAGMGRIALPNMVAAVSNAGGLGVYGAGTNPPDRTRAAVREIRSLTSKPFGANVPLALPNAKENAKVLLEEKVPIINYSMGKGDWICEAAHAYGGKVMASVTNQKLARSAQKHGCDAVIAAGYESAGHAGAITTFALIPRLAEIIDIPIIAAGGIANGAGIIAALALGAGGVSMGTRFWTTVEGPMRPAWKNKAVELDANDTVISDRFDGVPNRMMGTPGAYEVVNSRMLNLFGVFVHSFEIARELNIPWIKLVQQTLRLGPRQVGIMMRMSHMLKAQTATMTGDDINVGYTASGMSVGLIHDIPTVAELMDRLVAELEETQRRLAGISNLPLR